MKTSFFLSALVLAGVVGRESSWGQFPNYDHVVIVVEENHGYNQIIGSPSAPYINGTLATQGVLIQNAYGEQHPSQPNYFWLFSGSNQGITTDGPYWTGAAGPVFNTPNIYTALEAKFPSTNFFGGYVDSGSANVTISDYYSNTANYANRHVPWLGFTNINGGNPAGITKDFATQFAGGTGDYASLPRVSFVTPALNHDMHDYNDSGGAVSNTTESALAIQKGDTWLQDNLGGYAEWAKTHNSLLIVTWDENSTSDWPTPVDQGGNGTSGGLNPDGLTAPNLGFQASPSTSGPNQIAMLFYGANLAVTGNYTVPGAGVNNVNLLRTVESFYDLAPSGNQTSLATAAGMDNGPITGIFAIPEPSALLLLSAGALAVFLMRSCVRRKCVAVARMKSPGKPSGLP